METTQAVLTWLYTTMTGSSTLKTAMGLTDITARIYHLQAPTDPPFPYLVHRLGDAEWPFSQNDYLLDIWAHNDSPAVAAAQALSIKDALKTLLNQARFTTTSSEVIDGRIEWIDGEFIPTDNEHVFQYATVWGVRYFAKTEVANTLG